jgi:hypothetical protein
MATVWRAKAGTLFDVSIPNAAARRDISGYAAALNISDDAALRSVGGASLRFHALSLSADARTIPVIHSDEGFELLFGHPAPAALGRAVTALMRPFPAGLLTDAGVVVANPVFADPLISRAHEKPTRSDLSRAAGGARRDLATLRATICRSRCENFCWRPRRSSGAPFAMRMRCAPNSGPEL